MTLILRSNAVSSASIGNVHGYIGPSDYSAMLDFSIGEYYLTDGGRTDISLSSAVSVARASPAPYLDRNGVLRSVSANTPRITHFADLGVSGVVVSAARTNLATSASSQSVSIPAASASNRVVLSYRGGSASLSATELTLEEQYMDAGRTVKKYTRSVGTSFSATMTASGAADLIVCDAALGDYSGIFGGYSTTIAQETLSLGPALVALLGGGSGTVIARCVYFNGGSSDVRTAYNAIAVKSGAPQGGVYTTTTHPRGAEGTHAIITAPDGAAINASRTTRTSVTGTMRRSHVVGLTVSGNGDTVGLMAGGKANRATGLGALFGTPAYIAIGADTGSTSGAVRLGGIVTHVVVYNRLLTEDEAWLAASGWGV